MIPEGWKKCRLDEVGEVRGGLAKGKTGLRDAVSYPYLRVANVQDGYLNLETIKEIVVSRCDVERYTLKSGDVLMTEGGDFDKLGRGTVWRGEIENCLHQNHIFAVRLNADVVLPDFFSALSASRHGRSYFLSCAKRSTNLASINSSQLKMFPVLVPPLEEQRRIAEILATWDRAIEATEKLIANSQAQKKALMQQLLTGKKRLPGFSGEWRVTTLGTFGEFIKGAGITRSDLVEHGLPAIRYGEIYTLHHYIVESFGSFISREVANQSTRLAPGDIVFTCSGETAEEIGKCVAFLGREEAYAGGDTIILRNHQQSPEFLGYALNSEPVCIQKTKLGQGNSVVHISARNLASIAVALPPTDEQKAIASILCDMRRGIAVLQLKLAALNTEKSALMQQLLTGKRRVKLPSAQEEAAA